MDKHQSFPVECLLNNFISKELRAVLAPISLSQSLFLTPQFSLAHGFITPTNATSHIKSFIAVGLYCAMLITRYVFFKNVVNFTNDIALDCALLTDLIINTSGITLIAILNISHSQDFVLLIVKLQQALLSIDLNYRKVLQKECLWSWIRVGVILSYHFIDTIYSIVLNIKQGRFGFFALSKLGLAIFDLYQIYVIIIVALITSVLSFWNQALMRNQQAHLDGQLTADSRRNYFKAMEKAYRETMQALELCKKVYKFTILYKVMIMFCAILIYLAIFFQNGQESSNKLKNGTVNVLRQLSAITWNLFNVVLVTCVCATWERLYAEVRAANATCAQLSAAHDFDVSRLCKNVVRYKRARWRRLTTGGLRVSATLPLRVVHAVAAYTAVFLQFKLLSLPTPTNYTN